MSSWKIVCATLFRIRPFELAFERQLREEVELMVRTLELRATQSGTIWSQRPLISARGLLSCMQNMPSSSYDKQPARFRSVTFNSTGDICAATDAKGRVFAFFVTANRYALVSHLGVPTIACCFCPIRKTELLVTCEDETTRCIDVQSQTLISTLRGHRYPARCASFQRSGKLALTASQDAVILWDTNDWSRYRVLNAGPGVEAAAFVPRGDLVAVCFQDDTIMMWELESLALRYRFSLPEHEQPAGLQQLAVSQDYKMLVASGRSSFVYMWEFESQTILRIIELPPPINQVISHDFLPGHNSMLSVLGNDGRLCFMDIAVRKPKITLEISNRDRHITASAIEMHSRYLAACTDDGCLLLYDLEIARETAMRAQAKRRMEGLTELEANMRLETRSGLHHESDERNEHTHPVPSKLIDSLFGPKSTTTRQSELKSERVELEKDQTKRYAVRTTADGNNGGAVEAISPSLSIKNARPARTFVQASKKTRSRKPVSVLQAPATILSEKEIMVNKKRLEGSLKSNGSYPSKYRLLVWRFLLRLPKNEESFRSLVAKGNHPAFVRLYEQYPLQNSRVFRRLRRVLSALVYWCPAFGEVSYLPAVVYPFVKIFPENDLAAFETCMSVLLHWCRGFLVSLPYPPVFVLNVLERELERRDPQLHDHLVKHDINGEIYGWGLLQTLFTEVLSEEEWLVFWDHLFTYSETPELLFVAVIAYLVYFRTALLATGDRFSIEQFFHQQNAIKMSSFIQLLMNLREQINLNGAQSGLQNSEKNGDGDITVKNSYWPLPSGQFPAFANYPTFVVDFQISERNRIALEENELLRKREQLEQIEDECAKLTAEHEAWMREKKRVFSAEEKRRKDAVMTEKIRMLNLKTLDYQTRKRRLERLNAMERAAQETLEQTSQMFQAEYERMESALAQQKERTDFEIASRTQEEELQRVEFETEQRIMEIHKQRDMEERVQQLRNEFMARVKQNELHDLLKFENWKREDEQQKRDAKVRLKRREQLSILHQEQKVRKELERELLSQLVAKEKELLDLETKRSARQQDQQAYGTLEREIEELKQELTNAHVDANRREHVENRYKNEEPEEVKEESDDDLLPSDYVRFTDPLQRRSTSSATETKAAAASEAMRTQWREPLVSEAASSILRESPSSSSSRQRKTTNLGDDNRFQLAKHRSVLKSSSSSGSSSFNSGKAERTMEELALLEKALGGISSASSSSNSDKIDSDRGHRSQQERNVASNLHARSFSSERETRVTTEANRTEVEDENKENTRAKVNAAVFNAAKDVLLSSEYDEDEESDDEDLVHLVQRPITELEKELGIRFDELSDEEKENDSYMEDDRARLLLRARKILKEQESESEEEL